jgi:hypothetical protein
LAASVHKERAVVDDASRPAIGTTAISLSARQQQQRQQKQLLTVEPQSHNGRLLTTGTENSRPRGLAPAFPQWVSPPTSRLRTF